MDAANRNKHIACSIGFEPIDEEEGEHKAVKDVYERVSPVSVFEKERRSILLLTFNVTKASPAYCR